MLVNHYVKLINITHMKKRFLLGLVVLLTMGLSAQVTYTVTVPEGTNACYIAGDMTSWSHQEMNRVDATHYTITIATANETQKYKYCSGPNWAYEEKQADCSGAVADRTYAANDVVACWAAVYVPSAPKQDVVIKVKVPETWTTPKIHFWGDKSSTWPGENMVQVGEWWVYTFEQINIANIIFNNGLGAQTSNITNVSASTCYQVNADNSYQAISCEPVVAGRIYTVKVPAGTKDCYIAGDFQSPYPNWGQIRMDQVNDSVYTTTISNATGAEGYKYCSGPSWDYVEKQANCADDVPNRTYASDDVVACWAQVFDPLSTSVSGAPDAHTLVYTDGSAIRVRVDSKTTAAVYSLQGVLLQQAEFGSNHEFSGLSKGVYIVKLNGVSSKVLLK